MTEAGTEDDEFVAMRAVFTALKGLPDDEARVRVLSYAASRLGLAAGSPQAKSIHPAVEPLGDGEPEAPAPATTSPSKFATFAELFDAAHPQSNADKALVAGYWLQVCGGAESFSGLAANTELKHLGEAAPNITNAIDSLKNQKPALALQLKKSGKSQQARKSYKITVAGVKAVEAMIHG
ncbi:hypothetical protein FJW04_02515 [Mesorhizobium sp. B2-7-3]|uniref:hypothetical protein n=1 Tax=Mesorhizobium sp. B2-7-3 TaxID=2589907 RepID=UPI001126ED6E|nr:hypothetical protein [Mesorhizobium sp. B2-7-3]TPJ20226.1 hypothetical protein FJW04_02515 [Mesorhizobium sp. B2-7-3]